MSLCVYNITGQYFFYSFDFAIITLTGRDFTVDASANTNVGCDTLRSFGMHCSMTIVDGLRYFRPWAFCSMDYEICYIDREDTLTNVSTVATEEGIEDLFGLD